MDGRAPDRTIIATARDAAELFIPAFAGAHREVLLIAYLDVGLRLIKLTGMRDGGVGEIALPVRAVVGEALEVGAHGIVVAHNHPSGHADPSEQDRLATRVLAQAAQRLGIQLHDHLIFAAGECRSFRALGLL